jgi:hypothetical protein
MRMIRRCWQTAILAVTGPIAALGGLVALLAGGLLVPAVAIPAIASWHRGRYAALAGEQLTRPARGRDLISQLAFCLLLVPLSAVSFTVVMTLPAVSAAGFGWLSYGSSVPFRSSDTLHYGDPCGPLPPNPSWRRSAADASASNVRQVKTETAH